MSVDDYVSRVETINKYISFMDIGVTGFTERELIRSVIMQRIPPGWRRINRRRDLEVRVMIHTHPIIGTTKKEKETIILVE